MSKEPGGEWLTVSQAAQVLGISPRAVQKRCHNGKLAARRVSTPAGDRWEVQAANLDASWTRTGEPIGREPREQDASIDAASRSKPREPTREQGAGSRPTGREQDANEPTRETELREEVQFLRSLLEARDRDAAELRAALREALRLAPKQLPEGGKLEQVGTGNKSRENDPQAALTTNASQSGAAAKQNAQRPKLTAWQRVAARLLGIR
jgi:hypothetical protein